MVASPGGVVVTVPSRAGIRARGLQELELCLGEALAAVMDGHDGMPGFEVARVDVGDRGSCDDSRNLASTCEWSVRHLIFLYG
jgi:hypothetical protein